MMLKMASSIRRLVFVVLVSALLVANALPLEESNQQIYDDEGDDSYPPSHITYPLAEESSFEAVKRGSSDLSNNFNENGGDSELASLRNDQQTRNKILVQKLSNILRELKEAKLSSERAAVRDTIFSNKQQADNSETSSVPEEAPKPEQPRTTIYKGNFQKNKLDHKRDCHLGLGMGYLCHAYSITKYAQHHKLMQDPRNPGK